MKKSLIYLLIKLITFETDFPDSHIFLHIDCICIGVSKSFNCIHIFLMIHHITFLNKNPYAYFWGTLARETYYVRYFLNSGGNIRF